MSRVLTLPGLLALSFFLCACQLVAAASARPYESEKGLEVFTEGGDTKINSLKVHELKSIWR
jgi:hypothetical protein